jgi:glycosyltransferase involved in cell wall biosynthesis
MNLLIAPVHYYFDPTYGSEPSWANNIIENLARNLDINIWAICGFGVNYHLPENVHILQVGSAKTNVVDKAGFMYKYFNRSKDYLKKVDIVQHMFPFGFRQGFNPLAVFGCLKQKRFIIGPIEYPQHFFDFNDFELGTGGKGTKSKLLYRSETAALGILKKPIEALHKNTLSEAEALIFDSKKCLDLYQKTYPRLLSGKILKVFPPGVEDKFFTKAQSQQRPYFEILTVGYLLKRKGIQYLLQAMPEILREIKTVRLSVVGDGPYKTDLMRIAKQLSLTNQVTFTGKVPRDNLPQIYAQSDVYVQPSLSETFPSTIREAMAANKPVVATSVGVVNEYIQDSVTGCLVKAQSSGDLAKSIIHLLNDVEWKNKIAKQGRKYAEDSFRWDHLGKCWSAVYESVI